MDDLLLKLQTSIERELVSEELTDLEPDIYTAVSITIKNIRLMDQNSRSKVSSTLTKREIEMLYKLVDDLLTLRIKKFFNNLLASKNDTKLTPQEKYIIEPIYTSIRRNQQFKEALLYGFTTYIEKFSKLLEHRMVLLKFKQPTEQFVGTDLKTYGPFEKGDMATIPIDNAKILIDKDIVIDVSVV